MNYGMYISASGMSTQMARQDVLSNNLANVNTTGFKPDVLAIRQRDAARREDGLMLPSNMLLEKLGGGVMPTPTRIDVSPAPLERTANPLDIAIEGEGFFTVRAGPGDAGLRLTRDGRFAIGPDGSLITATSGMSVLDDAGAGITLDPTLPVEIDTAGRIRQGGQDVALLSLAAVPRPEALIKAGQNLLRLDGQKILGERAAGRIAQGMLEISGVNSISAMMGVTSASRAAEGNATIIGYISDMMSRAISGLGRVA